MQPGLRGGPQPETEYGAEPRTTGDGDGKGQRYLRSVPTYPLPL